MVVAMNAGCQSSAVLYADNFLNAESSDWLSFFVRFWTGKKEPKETS
jgi:hypothetical protein